jgi:glyoxylase-like metal-dependent hydrolase (beta-lactamase superfamily II)
MHVDHVGWNTRWDGMQWVPTFPNARYLFGRLEWAHMREEVIPMGDVPIAMAAMLECATVIADSIRPIVDHKLVDFVETNHRITEDVTLFPTPGHTPGHVSVAVNSAGMKAIIAGDVIHHPVQIFDPSISTMLDSDRSLARITRQTLIDEIADSDSILLGTHFVAPSGGRIVRTGRHGRFIPCGRPETNSAASGA